MTTQITNKQVNIVSDVNLNNNNIYNANINYNNVSNKPKINGIELNGDKSSDILGLQNKLNEFTITQSIFDNYKNQYNVANLKQIIIDYNLQGIVNLNDYNFFLDNLELNDTFLMFKNGQVIFDENGNNAGCDIGLDLTDSTVHFINCRVSGPHIEGDNPLISLNDSFVHFKGEEVFLKFVNQKNFIKTNNSSLVRLEDVNINLAADPTYPYAEGENNFGIIGIKAATQYYDNETNILHHCNVECTNTQVTITNDVADNNVDLHSYFLSTAPGVTAEVRLLNTSIRMYGNGMYHKSFDISLDNTDMEITNSTIDGDVYVRRESDKIMIESTAYNQGDDLYAVVDALHSWTDTNDTIASITVNNTTFSQEADGSGFYEFTYDGSDWNLQHNGEDEGTVDLTDYGISYTLQTGEQLYDGCNIKIDYNHDIVIGLRVLQNFTSAATIDLEYIVNLIENNIVERTGIRAINNFVNSIVVNNVDPIDFFIEYKKGITALNDIYTNNVFTNRIDTEEAQISTLNVDTEDYFIPISDSHLQSNNVKDAIKELAENGGGTELVAGDNILIEGSTISAIVPTQVSELENDSGYTTVADVNSEIIALSNELDVALNINSYQAVNNNTITTGIENSKVAVVEDFVTTLPTTVTANQSYLNITNNKIYSAVKRKELDYAYTNTNLTLLSNGRLMGFGTSPTQTNRLTYNSNAWSYIFPICLMFTTTGFFTGTGSKTSRIFTLDRTDDNSTLFAIDLVKTQISGNNNHYIKFSTINRDGTIKEEISSNNITGNNNSIIEIRITKSCYINVSINNKVNSIKYMDSLNASTSQDNDFYYALPVLATIKGSYSVGVNIYELFGLNSYLSYGYMGPSGTNVIVHENSNNYQLDSGTDLVKNKLIVNSTEKKLYEYDGTQLNEIGGGGSSSVLKKQLYDISELIPSGATNITTLDVSSDFTTVVDVLKNGQEIYENYSYTISSNILTFVTPLIATDVICVKGEE